MCMLKSDIKDITCMVFDGKFSQMKHGNWFWYIHLFSISLTWSTCSSGLSNRGRNSSYKIATKTHTGIKSLTIGKLIGENTWMMLGLVYNSLGKCYLIQDQS